MKSMTPIKVYFFLIISAILWWGIWGHLLSSAHSDYWFKENENNCAPAYPFVALGIILISWGSVACRPGGIKYYGNWKRDRWIIGGFVTFFALSIFALVLFK